MIESSAEVFSTLVTGAELASRINVGRIKYFWNKFIRRPVKVLLYGDSGVGKTQFLNTLTGNNIYSTQRTRVTQKRKLILSSGRKIIFLDTPGHQSAEMHRGEILNQISRGKIRGVINVVNYGYQDSLELQEHPDTAFNVDTKEVKLSFLKENRKLEITRTKEFISRITPNIKLDWVITVINKADIWYSNKEEVYNYYSKGEYGKELAKLMHSVTLFTVPFCSVITPFANREMRLIFSEREKKTLFDNITVHLENLVSKNV